MVTWFVLTWRPTATVLRSPRLACPVSEGAARFVDGLIFDPREDGNSLVLGALDQGL